MKHLIILILLLTSCSEETNTPIRYCVDIHGEVCCDELQKADYGVLLTNCHTSFGNPVKSVINATNIYLR